MRPIQFVRVILKSIFSATLALLVSTFNLYTASAQNAEALRNPPHINTSPNPVPQLVRYMPNKIFIPQGFDDNDPNAQIVVHGELPNDCYRSKPITESDYKIDPVTKEIQIEYKAYYYPGCFCSDIQHPFYEPINLSKLSAGNYSIALVKPNGGTVPVTQNLQVAQSKNPGPDDEPYAYVESAFIKNPQDPIDSRVLVLRGDLGSTCKTLKNKPEVTYQEGNVVLVRPIVHVETENCKPAKNPYLVEVELKDAKPGEHLVHVRSLSGTAHNIFTEFQ